MVYLSYCALVAVFVAVYFAPSEASDSSYGRQCSLSSLPILPSEEAIAKGIELLSSREWNITKKIINSGCDRIPRIFFLTGKKCDSSVLPHHKRMLKTNSRFGYVCIDNHNAEAFMSAVFHGTSYLWAFRSLNKKLGAGKADLIRYALMYVFGGVYLDTDSVINNNIDHYLQPHDGFVLASETYHFNPSSRCFHPSYKLGNVTFHDKKYRLTTSLGLFKMTQAILVSRPRHPFMSTMMANVVDIFKALKCHNDPKVLVKNHPQFRLLCTTGPDMLTASALQVMYSTPHVVYATFGVRYAGVNYADMGGVVKLPEAEQDLSPHHWKNLIGNGTSLFESDHSGDAST